MYKRQVNEYDEKINYLILNKNTYGDKTKINDVDRFYDLIITWDNPVNYYVGSMEQLEILENHYIKNNNELSVSKDDKPVSYTHLDVYKRQVYNSVYKTSLADNC